jgi:hypothetical protein
MEAIEPLGATVGPVGPFRLGGCGRFSRFSAAFRGFRAAAFAEILGSHDPLIKKWGRR